MNTQLKLALPIILASALAACNGGGDLTSAPGPGSHRHGIGLALGHPQPAIPACSGSRIGMAQCDVLVRTGVGPLVAALGPADLQSAYRFPTTQGAGQVIAIVDAFDNPEAAADLDVYRSTYGLGTANFTKFNQLGQTSNYPRADSGWGVEIDVDIEMVSASCPLCTIYLVEANTNEWSDIEIAEAEAIDLGATVVSNSFGGTGADAAHFNRSHVTYLASSGDSGFGIEDPADFPRVISVGGTTLIKGGGTRGWTESVWFGTGAGCSTEPKPRWQRDPGCPGRTANDVSAVADPATGVLAYDTFDEGGWFVVGGTSVSSPLLAGAFGLAGNSTLQNGGKTFWEPKHHQYLYPIVAGGDGSCDPKYLCQAGTREFGKYSGPGGWGAPNGIGAF